MIHLWAKPGALNPEPVAQWLVQNVKNLESIFVRQGIHFIQEDQPEIIRPGDRGLEAKKHQVTGVRWPLVCDPKPHGEIDGRHPARAELALDGVAVGEGGLEAVKGVRHCAELRLGAHHQDGVCGIRWSACSSTRFRWDVPCIATLAATRSLLHTS